MSKPEVDEFWQLSQKNDLLAMSETIHFDTETAISLADRFVNEDRFFLLESATAGPGGIARHSFMGFDPLWSFVVDQGEVTYGFAGDEMSQSLAGRDPLLVMQDVWQGLRLGVVPAARQMVDGFDLCSMGGACGYTSYETASLIEPKVGAAPQSRMDLPMMAYFLPRNFFVLDQLSRKLTVIRYMRAGDSLLASDAQTLPQAILDQEYQELESIIRRVTRPHIPPELKTKPGSPDFDACASTFPKDKFIPAVHRCLEEIKKGEIFQVQIGNRLSCEVAARPFDIFRHLRILNPSPYMVFFKQGDHHIVCASPEMMVNVINRKVFHRPIAGTRKRTWDAETDKRMRHELQTDEKERAEHVMLVDLSRNDVGRIAQPGSVQVDDLMVVEEYSHVFHLVSQVSADLRAEVSPFLALSASFPNGTVSGAPKIRAMQIINQLEPCSRQFYAGSLGMFDFAHQLRSTILIRTIHVLGGTASTQASAGIVYDSIPEQEWQETRNKMAACLVAMQCTY